MTSISSARQVLNDLYTVDGELTRLYGELDDNFLAQSGSGEKRILKIMHAGCDEHRVDLQCKAMAHLAASGVDLNLPQVIPTHSGQTYAAVELGGATRLVWSLRYCPGKLLVEFAPHADNLMASFGRMLGLLDIALGSFTHPAMRSGNKWALTRAAASRCNVKHIEGHAATLVDEVLQRFEEVTAGKLGVLPHSVIHNDANDGNVLVNVGENGDAAVDGLIDFGDMSYQPTICEVAIALPYAILGTGDPLSACAAFLAAYNRLNPIGGGEIAVLYDLLMTRLAVSIAIGAGRHFEDPDDEFGKQDKEPAFRALRWLAGRSPGDVERLFRKACSLPAIQEATTGMR
jgi:Ser/Thr protein kinase RdoA (MazF antagonist)